MSSAVKGGFVIVLVGVPLFALCAGLVDELARDHFPSNGLASAFVLTFLLLIPGGPVAFAVGALIAKLTGRLSEYCPGPRTSSLYVAGIGAVLVTIAASGLRILGSYATDGAAAKEEGLRAAPTLWVMVASLVAGTVIGALIGRMNSSRRRDPEELFRPAVVFALLLMLACVIHFSVWELQTLYEYPTSF